MRTHDDELRAQIQAAVELGNQDEVNRLTGLLENPQPDEMVEPAREDIEEMAPAEELLYDDRPPAPEFEPDAPHDDMPAMPAPPGTDDHLLK